MAIKVRQEPSNDFILLVWTSDVDGEEIMNLNGVQVSHITKVITGSVELEMQGEVQTLNQNDEITLPTLTPYLFRTLTSNTEIRCFYPKNLRALFDLKDLVRSSVDRVVIPTRRKNTSSIKRTKNVF